MRMSFKGNFVALATNSRKSQDGKNTYHSIAIQQQSEAGTVPCTEDLSGIINPYSEYTGTFEYNDKYNSLRLIGIPVLATSAASTQKSGK